MAKILQINYKLGIPASDFMKASAPVAEIIAKAGGLGWKIWLVNETDQEGGGIYLFEDEDSLNAFLSGPVIAKLKAHPAVKELSIKQFDVAGELSAVTRGPVAPARFLEKSRI
jgi:hypothetical protein